MPSPRVLSALVFVRLHPVEEGAARARARASYIETRKFINVQICIYDRYLWLLYILWTHFQIHMARFRGVYVRDSVSRIGGTRGMNCEFFMTTTFVAPILFDDDDDDDVFP